MAYPRTPPGPTAAPWAPGPSTATWGAYAHQAQRGRERSGGTMLIAAAVLHLLSILVSLVVFQAIASAGAGRTVTLGEILDVLSGTVYYAIIVGGIFAQVLFAVASGAGASALFRGRSGAGLPVMVVGIIAAIFSIAVFGGFVGLIAGVLAAVGGNKGRPKPIPLQPPPPAYGWAPPAPQPPPPAQPPTQPPVRPP